MGRAEVIVTGLEVPEGPVLIPGDRVAFVQQVLGRVSVLDKKSGEVTTLSDAPGAPNSATWSTLDECIYVPQNGGVVDAWRSEVRATPGIERVNADGSRELVASHVDGHELLAPNDLVFGPDGRLYFTDPSEAYDPPNRKVPNHLYALGPDGKGEALIEVPPSYTNGLAFGADGRLIWVESYNATVCQLTDDRTRQVLCTLPEGHIPDGIDVAADGRIFVTTVTGRGVDVVSPDGELLDHLPLDGDALPTNCCFDGADLWVTDFGEGWSDQVPGSKKGRLWKIETDAQGRPPQPGGLR